MKKIIALVLSLMLIMGLAGCGAASDSITAISREQGSGTRGAFVELFGIEQKNGSGEKVDMTRADSEETNSTAVMLTTVAGNKNAIGYVSLDALNDSVKALKIDGAAPTVENIENGSYKISRPFNVAFKGELTAAAADFMAFIMSAEGQAVVSKTGYIAVENNGAYGKSTATGSVVVAGSSSVAPLMEKLKEAYEGVNSAVKVTVQQTDSTSGMTSTAEGLCDIGMASRDLKDSEKSAGLVSQVIATDGIAVIVNSENAVDSLTLEQVQGIYLGSITSWGGLNG